MKTESLKTERIRRKGVRVPHGLFFMDGRGRQPELKVLPAAAEETAFPHTRRYKDSNKEPGRQGGPSPE